MPPRNATGSSVVRAAWRRGAIRTLPVVLVLLVALLLPGSADGGYGWNFAMGSGIAAAVLLSAMAWWSRGRAAAPLPAAFHHHWHVYAGRIAVIFAVVHSAGLVVQEPLLLADLGPTGPGYILGGSAAVVVMALLATTPGQRGRQIHESGRARLLHTALAVLAIGMTLIHLLAVDYASLNWRRSVFCLLLAVALVAAASRPVRRRSVDGRTNRPAGLPARPLARHAALVSALLTAAALLAYAAAA